MSLDRQSISGALVIAALMISACSRLEDVRNRARQVGTYADLQEISWNLKKRNLKLTDPGAMEQLKSAVETVRQGRDRWGRPFRYSIQLGGEGGSYVVYSTGADGVRDSADDSWYLELTPRSIKGEFDHDIVFRDGRPVTNAGN